MKKYVKYSEVKDLYEHMDENSILVVFQYIPGVHRINYFQAICEKLKHYVPTSKIPFISDNQIMFLILTKEERLSKLVGEVLRNYAKVYNLVTKG